MTHEELRSEKSADRDHARKNAINRGAAGDDVLEALDAQAHEPTPPSSSFGRALRDVAIVATLLGGGVYLYNHNVTINSEIAKISSGATEMLKRDDLRSLREAESKYEAMRALDSAHPSALAGLADVYFRQWSVHGLEVRGNAEQFSKLADAQNIRSADRFAVAAYLKIADGHAADAERDINELFEQKLYDPKLAHAYAWAMLEQGRYTEANQTLRSALEADFSNVRLALTLADVALRQGDDRGAIRHLERVLGSAMSPEHEVALGWIAALRAKTYGNLVRPARALQTLAGRADSLGPTAKADQAWAEGELELASGQSQTALDKAELALKTQKGFPPYFDLKARALAALGKLPEAYSSYKAGMKAGPTYRGLGWALARMKSEHKDDDALTQVAELEKTDKAHGAEYEIFRGQHALRMGRTKEAESAFHKAAELGDDPEILLGLAKITFEQEKKKGSKADLEKVALAFQDALAKKSVFPELHEAMAQISLWNFQLAEANKSFVDAEAQYKKLNRPVPELLAFYDRAAASFEGATEKKSIRKDAERAAADWKKKKSDYRGSLATADN